MVPLKKLVKKSVSHGQTIMNREQRSIGMATIEMMILVLITKILGLVKMGLLAGKFGAGRNLDIFYIANTIPELIFNIIAVGSVNAAFVPAFTRCMSDDDKPTAIKLFQKAIHFSLIAFVVLAGVMFVFAPSVIDLSLKVSIGGASSAFSVPEQELAITMMRVMLVSPILLGISSIIGAYLMVKQRYFVTRLAPLLYNVGTIVGIVVFVPLSGDSVVGLAYGIVLASVLHLASQLPTLMNLVDFSKVKDVVVPKKYIDTIRRLALPRMLAVATSQIGLVARNVIALNLIEGSLTSYQFARNIFAIAVDLFGVTTAEAVFPRLSRLGVEGNKKELAKLFGKGMQQVLFLTIPVTVILLVLRLPVVRLVFGLLGSGFTWQDTVMTSWSLSFLSILVVVQALISLLLRGFYALEDTKTPLVVSGIALVLNFVFSIWFVTFFSNFHTYTVLQPYGALGFDTLIEYFKTPGGSPVAVGGLAFAGFIAWTLEAVVLMVMLNRKIRFLGKVAFLAIAKKATTGLIMAIGLYSSFRLFDRFLDTQKTIQLFVVLVLSTLIGVSLYLASEYVLDDDELGTVKTIFARVTSKLSFLSRP